MSFDNFLKPSVPIRPTMNVGCLMGIPVGRYHVGKYGESILNGGLQLTTGVGGRGNSFKSTLAHFFHLRCLDRYCQVNGSVYDTEPPSVSPERIYSLAEKMDNISGIALVDEGRLFLTDSTVMLGDEWFDALKNAGDNRILKENLKSNTGLTPFIDKAGNFISCLYPVINECDSLSMMPIGAVEAIYEKHNIGAGGMNVEALKASGAKSQMLMQLSTFPGTTGMHFIFTAHVGDDLALDPYAPPAKKLSFLKNKVKFKQVPEKFSFVMNNLWYCLSTTPLQNDTTKGPEYPRNPQDNMKGDTDLQEITLMNLRGKAGPSGMPFTLVVSQSEGILPSLSEFHYIKNFNRYGLGGNLQNYFLDLLPDVALSRTTVRNKIDNNAKLRRALEITSEMCQMQNLWHDLEPGLLCTPAELYKDITAAGYDWDVLLEDTRGYWVFEGDPTPLQFLSTMDLLNIRKGTYKIYWYDDYTKARAKAQDAMAKLGKATVTA